MFSPFLSSEPKCSCKGGNFRDVSHTTLINMIKIRTWERERERERERRKNSKNLLCTVHVNRQQFHIFRDVTLKEFKLCRSFTLNESNPKQDSAPSSPTIATLVALTSGGHWYSTPLNWDERLSIASSSIFDFHSSSCTFIKMLLTVQFGWG